jgi:hypothetical protein
MHNTMVRLLLLTFLLLGSALAQDTTTAPHVRRRNDVRHPEVQHWRRLESSEDNQNSNEGDGHNNDDATSMYSQAKDRFGEDFLSMWSIPPNEWSEEYWEVLGVFLGFILLCLCCCLSCCLLPLWAPRDEPKAPKTLLNSDPTNDNELKPGSSGNAAAKDNDAASNKDTKTGLDERMILEGPPSLEQPTWGPSDNSIAQSTADESSAVQPPFGRILSYDDTDVSGYDTPKWAGPPHSKNKRKSLWSQRKAVWNEVVSAWSEFLGCSDEGQEQAYKKYKEPALSTSLWKKSSSARKSKPPRNYRYNAPSFRRKSDIEYEAAASSSKQRKYDRMMV